MDLRKSTPARALRRVTGRLGASRKPVVQKPYRFARQAGRRLVNSVSNLQLGWMASLQSARWLDDTTFEVSGWAFERGYGFTQASPRIRVWLAGRGRVHPVEAQVEPRVHMGANTRMKSAAFDYANTAFVARFDVAELIGLATEKPRRWRVMIEVGDGRRATKGWFKNRGNLGSAFYLTARTFGDVQVTPEWIPGRGLWFRSQRPAVMATSAALAGRQFTAVLRLAGIEFASATLVSAQGMTRLAVASRPGGLVEVTGRVPELHPDAPNSITDAEDDEGLFTPEEADRTLPVLSYRLVVTDAAGREHVVQTALPQADLARRAALPFLYGGAEGGLRLRDTPAMMIVTSSEFEAEPRPGIRLEGVVLGELAGASLILTGARARRQVTLEVSSDGRFTAFAPWLVSAWNQPDLPPMSGRYTLRGITADEKWFRVSASPDVISQAPRLYTTELFNLRVGVGPGRRPAYTISPPLTATEVGSFHQARLQRSYHSAKVKPKDQIYFESFNGRQATCNPLALDREVARRFPHIVRYWGVVDRSVAVPDGAIPVVAGTTAWWDARESSRVVIANEWLKGRYKHHPHQVVLQTWHGSMLKRIGLDRPNRNVADRMILLEERAKWDYLLSQNAHSTDILRRAYDWHQEIWEEGYPRNDDLSIGTGDGVRQVLGVAPGQKAVLYAPTWRDTKSEMVTFLDLERLTAQLGPDYVILLRGHSRTVGHGADVLIPGVIDVTTYPNITDLFLAADAMITDYSSVMFDYSVTGRPMIFFVPDLDDYRDSVRGVYFDLSTQAPGPVLFTQEEVVAAIQRIDHDRPAYAERYRAWRDKYNSHDDGNAATRVVDRLFDAVGWPLT